MPDSSSSSLSRDTTPLNGGDAPGATVLVNQIILKAVMISCRERDGVRRETLRQLAGTDWGEEVHVQMDVSTKKIKQQRQAETSMAAVRHAAGSGADYTLFLEDDVECNRHLRRNLEAWWPLQKRKLHFASLYNPNIRELRSDAARNYFEADPEAVYGSQAVVMSRAAAAYFTVHWWEIEGMGDIKMPRLAARLGRPLYYHRPSLVQHVGRQSVWGGGFHQAEDYQAEWKAAAG